MAKRKETNTMAVSKEAYQRKKEYIAKFDREHYRKFIFKTRYGKDDDIIAFLTEASKNKQLAIVMKKAIRDYMKKERGE